MIPELIGRLPVISTLNQLSVDDLARILTEPKDALIEAVPGPLPLRRRRSSSSPPTAIREIARLAKARGTGARALRSIMENLMLDIMYDLPEREPARPTRSPSEVVRGEESLFASGKE